MGQRGPVRSCSAPVGSIIPWPAFAPCSVVLVSEDGMCGSPFFTKMETHAASHFLKCSKPGSSGARGPAPHPLLPHRAPSAGPSVRGSWALVPPLCSWAKETQTGVSGNVASSDLGRYHKKASAALLRFRSASANTAGGWPPVCFCKQQLY